ncbi:MAG TPA: arginine deiminase-related protein [Sporichthya sp.]|nr:arginine deiminase-related protein [Sporichthya sp.]
MTMPHVAGSAAHPAATIHAPAAALTRVEPATVTTLPGVRVARPRHYLMCRPTFFEVTYAINPWMDPNVAVDLDLALRQWEGLRDAYRALGHTVSLIEPVAGLPDMVFAANGALIVDGKVLAASFLAAERQPEAPAYTQWLAEADLFAEFGTTSTVNEGEGDFLDLDTVILAGTGFRTSRAAHGEAQEFLGKPVISLQLVDPRFYHLDTAIAILGDHDIAYYPGAFSAGSNAVLRRMFPDAITVDEAEAATFSMNSVSDGRNVVVPVESAAFSAALRERGYDPVPVEMSEFRKSGGGPKCCTLELRS